MDVVRVGSRLVAIIESPTMIYLYGSRTVYQVEAVVGVAPCPAVANHVTHTVGQLKVKAEAVCVASVKALGVVVVVVVGITVEH